MSGSWAFGKHVVVMIIAATAFCIALTGLTTLSADAAPYPPTEPCTVTATARGTAAADGTSEYDVLGSGLGSVQPVRVVLATTGQQIGSAQTDTSGSFRTTVTAPPDADATAPDFTASSPQQTCTWTPPTQSAPPTPTVPTAPSTATPSARQPSANSPAASSGAGASGGSGGQPAGTGTAGGQDTGGAGTVAPGTGTSGANGSATASPAPTSTPVTPAPSASTSLLPPLAEPSPGSDTPFGIGLGIAAVLLVLGTLAVLLLTRRPER